MTCHPVEIPGIGRGFICTRTRRKRCACGRPATLECDWKVPTRKSGTCDAPICAKCTTSPAPGKDLCQKHKAAYEGWLASRGGNIGGIVSGKD